MKLSCTFSLRFVAGEVRDLVMGCKPQKSSTFTQGLSLSLPGYDAKADWTGSTAHDSDSVITSQNFAFLRGTAHVV